jgi:uncharacterized protein (TIRG00374 family)
MRRIPGTRLIRAALGVGILCYLVVQVPRGSILESLAQALEEPAWLGAGIACTFFGLLMGVLRWQWILRTQGFRISVFKVFRIFFIGQFFNAFMPGACGGDVARAYYVARDTKGRGAEAVSTVFVDRAVGLFSTILFCCVVIALRLHFFLTHTETTAPGILMVVFLLLAVLGILALFRRNLFEHFAIFRRMEAGTRLGALIRRAYEAFYLYRSHPRVLAATMALSLLNLWLLTLACVCFANALHVVLPHPLITHFTLFPIITTLSAVPITPGALGLREGLFVGLYGGLAVDQVLAISLSLLVYAGGLICSLLGGALFIGYTSEEYQNLSEELARLK